MRIWALAACAALISPGLSAQEMAVGGAESLKPAEYVAAKVSRLLRASPSAAAWQDLADALPELALSGDADLETTFEAARIASQMSLSPASASRPERPPVASGVPSWFNLVTAVRLAAILAGSLLVWRVVRSTLRVRAVPDTKGGPPVASRQIPVRFREACSLAFTGVPVNEVSARTGVPRDALRVLIGIGGR